MDTAGIAAFLVASQQQQTRMNVTTAVMKMQQKQDNDLLSMLDSGLAATGVPSAQASAPDGMGQQLDMTV